MRWPTSIIDMSEVYVYVLAISVCVFAFSFQRRIALAIFKCLTSQGLLLEVGLLNHRHVPPVTLSSLRVFSFNSAKGISFKLFDAEASAIIIDNL